MRVCQTRHSPRPRAGLREQASNATTVLLRMSREIPRRPLLGEFYWTWSLGELPARVALSSHQKEPRKPHRSLNAITHLACRSTLSQLGHGPGRIIQETIAIRTAPLNKQSGDAGLSWAVGYAD